jgi:hypothetical protein
MKKTIKVKIQIGKDKYEFIADKEIIDELIEDNKKFFKRTKLKKSIGYNNK